MPASLATLNKALAGYSILRNEDIPGVTIEGWITEFSRMEVPVKDICEAIHKTAYNEIFGKTQFSDFVKTMLENGMVYTRFEMLKYARQIAKNYIENKAELEMEAKKREEEMNKEFGITDEALKSFQNDLEARRETIKAEVNSRLDRIEEKLDEGLIWNYKGIINGERMG